MDSKLPLDFTYSPYIAAFFALIQADSKESDYCTVYSVSKEFIDDTNEFSIYTPKTDHNQRLLNQNGLFVKFNQPLSLENVLKKTVEKKCMMVKIARILIPLKDKNKAIEHLNSMNINYSTLFPDLDGASRHTNQVLNKLIKSSTIKTLR